MIDSFLDHIEENEPAAGVSKSTLNLVEEIRSMRRITRHAGYNRAEVVELKRYACNLWRRVWSFTLD